MRSPASHCWSNHSRPCERVRNGSWVATPWWGRVAARGEQPVDVAVVMHVQVDGERRRGQDERGGDRIAPPVHAAPIDQTAAATGARTTGARRECLRG